MEMPCPTAPTTTSTSNLAKPIASLKGLMSDVAALAFSPDRALLASASRDGDARLWDVNGPPHVRSNFGATDVPIRSFAYFPNSRTLIAGSGSLDGRVRLIDISDKATNELVTLQGARGAIHAVAVSPDGKQVAGGGEDRVLRIWEPLSASGGTPRVQLTGHANTITGLAYAPDSQNVATASRDGTVRLWTVGHIRSWERAAFDHPAEVTSVAWSADGKLIATSCVDHRVRIWDASGTRAKPMRELAGHTAPVRHLLFAKDKGFLVTVGDDCTVIRWDPHTGERMQRWQLSVKKVLCAAITRDGRYLAVGGPNVVLEIYRIAERR